MALLDIIRERYSCRSYIDKPIEREKLDQIFEAARLAPSAKNMQDWRFVAVSEKSKKMQVAESTNHPEIFGKAGVMIVACSNTDYVMRCGQSAGAILFTVMVKLKRISREAKKIGKNFQ